MDPRKNVKLLLRPGKAGESPAGARLMRALGGAWVRAAGGELSQGQRKSAPLGFGDSTKPDVEIGFRATLELEGA